MIYIGLFIEGPSRRPEKSCCHRNAPARVRRLTCRLGWFAATKPWRRGPNCRANSAFPAAAILAKRQNETPNLFTQNQRFALEASAWGCWSGRGGFPPARPAATFAPITCAADNFLFPRRLSRQREFAVPQSAGNRPQALQIVARFTVPARQTRCKGSEISKIRCCFPCWQGIRRPGRNTRRWRRLSLTGINAIITIVWNRL